MRGTLYCVCISRIKQLPEIQLKLFAVRRKKFLPTGWEHIDTLSPSSKLLFEAKKYEKEGTWNQITFLEFYKPNFINEIRSNPNAKRDLIRITKMLNSGKDVAFACYCGNHQLCHRGIIGEIYENNGYPVIYL